MTIIMAKTITATTSIILNSSNSSIKCFTQTAPVKRSWVMEQQPRLPNLRQQALWLRMPRRLLLEVNSSFFFIDFFMKINLIFIK